MKKKLWRRFGKPTPQELNLELIDGQICLRLRGTGVDRKMFIPVVEARLIALGLYTLAQHLDAAGHTAAMTTLHGQTAEGVDHGLS